MSRRSFPVMALAILVAASCSSGESAITAGNDRTTTTTGTAGTQVDGTTGSSPSSTVGGGDATQPDRTEPGTTGGASTTTSTTVPLADLPPCPTEALQAADDVVELTFWHGLTVENEDALTAATDAYNASQDRVHVTLQNQGGYIETIDEYFQSSQSSRPQLVMFPDYAARQTIDSGTVVPVGACIESSGFDTSPFRPSILQAYSTSGVQWGMPFNVSNPVLYYNRKMFTAAGLDPDQPPLSMDELRAVSQQLVDTGAASYGLAIDSDLDSGGGWFIEQWFANALEPFADHDNGRSGEATTVYFDDPYGVDLLTFLQGMVQDGLAFYVGDNSSGSDHFFKLADPSQPAAMTIGTSSALGSVISVLGSGLVPGLTTDDVGIGPMPTPSGTPGVAVGGAAVYIVADQSPAETAAAWDYITYLVSAAVQSQWTVATGYLPIRDDALELEPAKSTFDADPRYRVAYDQLAVSGDQAAAVPLLGPQRQIRTELANAVAAIMTGADVQESLTKAADIADAYLADYNATN